MAIASLSEIRSGRPGNLARNLEHANLLCTGAHWLRFRDAGYNGHKLPVLHSLPMLSPAPGFGGSNGPARSLTRLPAPSCSLPLTLLPSLAPRAAQSPRPVPSHSAGHQTFSYLSRSLPTALQVPLPVFSSSFTTGKPVVYHSSRLVVVNL